MANDPVDVSWAARRPSGRHPAALGDRRRGARGGGAAVRARLGRVRPAERLPQLHRVRRPRPPHGGGVLAGRPRLRRGEARARSRCSTASTTRRPRSSRTCGPRSTTTGTAACSAWRCTRSSRSAPRSTSPTRSMPSHGGTVPRGARARRRPVPHAAGPDRGRLRGQRPPVAAARPTERHDGARGGADRGLVPAVPEPLHRHGRCSVRTARCT